MHSKNYSSESSIFSSALLLLLLGQVKGIAIALGIVKVCQCCDSKLQLPRNQARFFNWWLMVGRDYHYHPLPPPHPSILAQVSLSQKRRHRLWHRLKRHTDNPKSEASLPYFYVFFFFFFCCGGFHWFPFTKQQIDLTGSNYKNGQIAVTIKCVCVCVC